MVTQRNLFVMACADCDGMGMRMVGTGAARAATPCPCVTQAKIDQVIRRAGIPSRYRQATFASYSVPARGNLRGVKAAVVQYVEEYLPGRNSGGLLLSGTIGTGKTHLAVAALRALMLERGQVGVFVDARDMFQAIKATFTPGSHVTEHDILQPILSADVLVLDELGAARTTDWTADIIENILNGRYNSQRSTIITTNYAPTGTKAVASIDDQPSRYARDPLPFQKTETLADRIGARMYSRVVEMCRTVQVQGEDYRAKLAQRVAV